MKQDITKSVRTLPDRFELDITPTLPEMGESKVKLSKSKPEITFGKWNDEIQLKVGYGKIKKTGQQNSVSKKFEWKDTKEELHAYPLEAGVGMEDGGFEIEVVLKEKSTTNVFEFQIEGAENLDFNYQPALTQEEIDEGDSRPENVVGSYAVYHKTKAHHRMGSINYATGKAFHIYRPKVIDDNGVEEWGELDYKNGLLSVTVPQAFLDNATYPVRVDPTLGYTTVGSTAPPSYSFSYNGSTHTATEDGDITSMSAYFVTNFAASKTIITDNSGAIITNGISDANSDAGQNAWQTHTFSTNPSIVDTTEYFLGVNTESSFKSPVYDTVTDQGRTDTGQDYTSPGDITATTNDQQMSVYITYTASGGGGGRLDASGRPSATGRLDATGRLSTSSRLIV